MSPEDRRRRIASVVLTAVAIVTAAPSAGQVLERRENLSFFDTGPLRIREQFLLGMGFLQPAPSTADVLRDGAWRIDLVQSITNTWVRSEAYDAALDERRRRATITRDELEAVGIEAGDGGVFFADGEVYRTSLAIRRGVGHGAQVFVAVPVLDFRGGVMDDAIEEFHEAFGFSDAERPGVPRDDYTVYFLGGDGHDAFRTATPGADIGDISLGAQFELPSPAAEWQLAVEGQVKLPTGEDDELYGSGSTDVGLQLLATRYWSDSCLHLTVGATHLGPSHVFELGSQTNLTAALSYEHRLGRSLSAVIQVQVFESPFDDADIDFLSDLSYLVDLGVKKGFGPSTVLFLAVSENVVNLRNSADFGVHAGVTWTFDGAE